LTIKGLMHASEVVNHVLSAAALSSSQLGFKKGTTEPQVTLDIRSGITVILLR